MGDAPDRSISSHGSFENLLGLLCKVYVKLVRRLYQTSKLLSFLSFPLFPSSSSFFSLLSLHLFLLTSRIMRLVDERHTYDWYANLLNRIENQEQVREEMCRLITYEKILAE